MVSSSAALSAGGGFIYLPANSLEQKLIVFVLPQGRGAFRESKLGFSVLWVSDFWGGNFTVSFERDTENETDYQRITFFRR